MSDTNNPSTPSDGQTQGAGERRPDQNRDAKPAMTDEKPASGGEGAAGAGGPAGFGTGS